MKRHIMLDLETLGTRPDAVILSIGAAVMDFEQGVVTDTFHVKIDPVSAHNLGGTIDPGTVMWWLRQSDDARKRIGECEGAFTLPAALIGFTEWATQGVEELPSDNVVIWGNGATFDNVVLGATYDRCGLRRPWQFWNDRCYRTLKNVYKDVPMVQAPDVAHDALSDAVAQANHLLAIAKVHQLNVA